MDAEVVSIQDILKKGFRFRSHDIRLGVLVGYLRDAPGRGNYLRKPAYSRAGGVVMKAISEINPEAPASGIKRVMTGHTP